ncbi:hypothetical protein OK349_04380 [Sphingomonas sp. BT-65]|uniref:hypothetical protein n=1 Tax=Sphingomonas sp. BT-65 TaxID=2989821 RepID=UPI00223663F1|nr:hypothetical protein [Sphingomonas sp. BT-65]MCW4460932.1 hypothetical protein [Sphingomonas sp. BT-65]
MAATGGKSPIGRSWSEPVSGGIAPDIPGKPGGGSMKSTGVSARIGRRELLSTGAALLAGGCVHCRFPPPAGVELAAISDAHAHFFNAADLPVAGFTKFVLIPRYFPSLPDFALALVDIIAFVAKTLSLSASEELRQLSRAGSIGGQAPSQADFAKRAAQAHRIGLGDVAPVADRLSAFTVRDGPGRRASHQALARLFGAEESSLETRRAAHLEERDFLAIIARDSDARPSATPTAPNRPRPQPAAEPEDGLQCPAGRDEAPPASQAQQQESVRTLLRWAWLMCQPRCAHVETYLKTIAKPEAQVRDAINLLVDFDRWLDDRPARGSGMREQVEYWTRYGDVSANLPGRIRLHSFAGFDPLRDAEERVLEGREAGQTSLAAMKRWVLAGRDPSSVERHRITGFKLYPPMGFRPDSNAGLEIGEARGGIAIHARWRDAGVGRVGAEIDRSLEDFFEFCVRENVPVFTHARESNIALPGQELAPSPAYWLTRIEEIVRRYPGMPPLRLCIGHFDMFSCHKGPSTDHDVLRRALALNRPDTAGRRKARIYFDFSFDVRILQGDGRTLLEELAGICKSAGDDGDAIMFGSDWIMLANQSNAADFLAAAHAAAMQVDFWRERADKLFRANLISYLTPAPGPGRRV